MSLIFAIIIAFALGLVSGQLLKVTITINHNQIKGVEEVKEIKFNESMADELDPEVRSYYDHNNGLNKF